MQIHKDFSFQAKLDLPYQQAVEKTISALKAEGFGVLTEIDVQHTFKQKLDVDFRKYTILGACNPTLAYKALNSELDLGLLLPCNVIVYEAGGGSVVSIIDPLAMLGMVHNPELEQVATEARCLLKRVSQSLSSDE